MFLIHHFINTLSIFLLLSKQRTIGVLKGTSDCILCVGCCCCFVVVTLNIAAFDLSIEL